MLLFTPLRPVILLFTPLRPVIYTPSPRYSVIYTPSPRYSVIYTTVPRYLVIYTTVPRYLVIYIKHHSAMFSNILLHTPLINHPCAPIMLSSIPAASVPYFRAMFTNDMVEANQRYKFYSLFLYKSIV